LGEDNECRTMKQKAQEEEKEERSKEEKKEVVYHQTI
jgi:hypothetical protein